MLYKILNKQVEIPIIFRTNISSTRGNNRRFVQLQCHLNCYSNSDAIRIWNSLPQQLIDCSNVELFRDGIMYIDTTIVNNHISNYS